MNNQYKTKVNISITIDTDIYIKIKTKPEFNLSGTVNDYLKKLLEDETLSKQDLEKELEENKAKSNMIEHELAKRMKQDIEESAKELSQSQKEAKEELDNIPIGYSFQARLEREKLFKEKPELKTKWESRS